MDNTNSKTIVEITPTGASQSLCGISRKRRRDDKETFNCNYLLGDRYVLFRSDKCLS